MIGSWGVTAALLLHLCLMLLLRYPRRLGVTADTQASQGAARRSTGGSLPSSPRSSARQKKAVAKVQRGYPSPITGYFSKSVGTPSPVPTYGQHVAELAPGLHGGHDELYGEHTSSHGAL